MKGKSIIVLRGQLGDAVYGDGSYRFLPIKYGVYNYSDLETIDASDIRQATQQEKISFIEEDFPWGKVVKTLCIGEYQIIEYKRSDYVNAFHVYIDFESTSSSYETLDHALIGAIARKNLEVNESSYAVTFISRMLEVNI